MPNNTLQYKQLEAQLLQPQAPTTIADEVLSRLDALTESNHSLQDAVMNLQEDVNALRSDTLSGLNQVYNEVRRGRSNSTSSSRIQSHPPLGANLGSANVQYGQPLQQMSSLQNSTRHATTNYLDGSSHYHLGGSFASSSAQQRQPSQPSDVIAQSSVDIFEKKKKKSVIRFDNNDPFKVNEDDPQYHPGGSFASAQQSSTQPLKRKSVNMIAQSSTDMHQPNSKKHKPFGHFLEDENDSLSRESDSEVASITSSSASKQRSRASTPFPGRQLQPQLQGGPQRIDLTDDTDSATDSAADSRIETCEIVKLLSSKGVNAGKSWARKRCWNSNRSHKVVRTPVYCITHQIALCRNCYYKHIAEYPSSSVATNDTDSFDNVQDSVLVDSAAESDDDQDANN
jgi:hypothetical protein